MTNKVKIKGYALSKTFLTKMDKLNMVKRKHPADRAERLKINEEKKARKGNKTIESIPPRPSISVPFDERDN